MPALYKIIGFAILVATFTAFIVLLAIKTNVRYNIRDYFDKKKIILIAQMLDCDFCLCFWITVILSIILSLGFMDFNFIVIPFISTPLARYLL